MDYRKASVYPSRSAGGRLEPTILVVHTTEGYGRDYLDRLFSGQILRDGKQKISVHWCIYRDGSVVEYAPWRAGEALKCIHAGESSFKGRRSCNNFALGYEIEHVAGDPYPEAVIQAVIELNAMVKAEYPGLELTEHRIISPGRKPDPTAPWDKIKGRVYAAWDSEEDDDMTEDEVRKIIRQEMEVVYSDTVDRDQKYLLEKQIIQAPRPKGKLASVSYVDSLLARVLRKALGE